MPIPKTLRYFFTALCSLLLSHYTATAQRADSTTVQDSAVKKEIFQHQLNLGLDISAPLRNALLKDRAYYEIAGDYFLRNEIYLAAEAGFGKSDISYNDLRYNTTNVFGRIGFNRVLLPRDNKDDWGGMLLGMRVAATSIQRSAATYTVIDSFWGNVEGAKPAKSFAGLWFEVTGGVRVELVKNLMAGWNIRGKFMLNSKSFNDLSPLYIAGYGRGDKNAVFDINFYLSYAMRWQRKGGNPTENVR